MYKYLEILKKYFLYLRESVEKEVNVVKIYLFILSKIENFGLWLFYLNFFVLFFCYNFLR